MNPLQKSYCKDCKEHQEFCRCDKTVEGLWKKYTPKPDLEQGGECVCYCHDKNYLGTGTCKHCQPPSDPVEEKKVTAYREGYSVFEGKNKVAEHNGPWKSISVSAEEKFRHSGGYCPNCDRIFKAMPKGLIEEHCKTCSGSVDHKDEKPLVVKPSDIEGNFEYTVKPGSVPIEYCECKDCDCEDFFCKECGKRIKDYPVTDKDRGFTENKKGVDRDSAPDTAHSEEWGESDKLINEFIGRWVKPENRPYLLDNDDNPGQRLRTAISSLLSTSNEKAREEAIRERDEEWRKKIGLKLAEMWTHPAYNFQGEYCGKDGLAIHKGEVNDIFNALLDKSASLQPKEGEGK